MITMRRKNDDTPIRTKLNDMLQETDMSFCDDEVEVSEVLGDTLEIHTPPSSETVNRNNGPDSISYDRFSQLLKLELENMKLAITSEITRTVTNILTQEIQTVGANLRKEFSKHIDTLQTEQTNINQTIVELNGRIETLETENTKVRSELQYLTENVIKTEQQEDLTKKLVIYGLNEFEGENENELIQRVSYMFNEIMGINLNPYIENINRIGRRGYRRPIAVDLISQRMTRYVLQNKHCFRNTGIAIGKFLNTLDLKQRNNLKQTMKVARQQGLPAYIKGSKVYIEGKEYTTNESRTGSSDNDNTKNSSFR